MSRIEYIAAGAIVLAALIGVYVYTRKRAVVKEERAAEQRRRGPVEHAECDAHRLFIAEKTAELSTTPDFDSLRRGNLNGEIARERARLTECERQANRREAVGQ